MPVGIHTQTSIGSSMPLRVTTLDMGELLRQSLDQLPADRMGDGDAAGRRRLLQADDEADGGAEAVVALDEDIGERDREAHLDGVVRVASGVAVGHRRLEGDCPAHAVLDIGEFDEAAVAHCLEHVAAVGAERRAQDAPANGGKLGERGALVPFDEARVAGHVERCQNRQFPRRWAHRTCIRKKPKFPNLLGQCRRQRTYLLVPESSRVCV